MASHRVGHDWSHLVAAASVYMFGEGNGKPLQYSCLENPMDGGAWWAAVHGVATSWSRLSNFTFTSRNGEGNGNPLQCSCLENPRDGRAWWAAVYGVAQSRTRLKQLGSSSIYVSMLLCRFIPPSPSFRRFAYLIFSEWWCCLIILSLMSKLNKIDHSYLNSNIYT